MRVEDNDMERGPSSSPSGSKIVQKIAEMCNVMGTQYYNWK